jgi:hypothetical protein
VGLHWSAVTDRDLATYRVYRGTLADFVPSEATLVGSTTDTVFVDAHAGEAIYKVVAVDVHGNASTPAVAEPPSLADVSGNLPSRLELSGAAPNPAVLATSMRLRLPQAANVEWSVFDPAGRMVRHLAARVLPAGEHSLAWDLRDDAGRAVGHGLYFARVKAAGVTFQQRVVVLR